MLSHGAVRADRVQQTTKTPVQVGIHILGVGTEGAMRVQVTCGLCHTGGGHNPQVVARQLLPAHNRLQTAQPVSSFAPGPRLVQPPAPERSSVLLTNVPLALQTVQPTVALLRPPSSDSTLPAAQEPGPTTSEQPMPVLVLATLPPPERPGLLVSGRPADDLTALVEKMPAPRLEARIASRTDSDPTPRRKVRPSDLLRAPALPSGSPPVSATAAQERPEAEGVPLSAILRQRPSAPPIPDPVYGAD
jgi:hypothetical protein